MAEVIIMPKLGFNMDEGQLVKWHKNIDDAVTKGEVLFEINTDKTTMPVEATADGTLLAILLDEGNFADVFTPIAVVGEKGEDYTSALEAASGQEESAAVTIATEEVSVSPTRYENKTSPDIKLTP
ncbi:2-oxo acid dehydrogenase subunit E2, partial [Tyzzerella sp. OttesenSCG-928-J15]|nr:2-oxo acid dehydrogenase subunit E2 [Tyzzerella sp. OttesenSCG-928-J15]